MTGEHRCGEPTVDAARPARPRGRRAALALFCVLLHAQQNTARAGTPDDATTLAPPATTSQPPAATTRATRHLADRRAWEAHLVGDRHRNDIHLQRLLAREADLSGLELLVASAPPDAPLPRRWGHALLRFVVRDGDPMEDIVLGLVAVPDRPRISYWAGLTGGYPLALELGTMSWALQTFVRDQDRPLTRWALPSTPAQRHALLVDLTTRTGRLHEGAGDARTGAGAFGSYTFAGNNCARGLVDRLADAGIVARAEGFGTRIPSRLPDTVHPAGGPLRPLPQVPSLAGVYGRAAEQLGITTNAVRRGAWPDEVGTLARLSVADRLALLWTVEMAPPAAREVLLASLPPPDTRPSLAEVFGVTARDTE